VFLKKFHNTNSSDWQEATKKAKNKKIPQLSKEWCPTQTDTVGTEKPTKNNHHQRLTCGARTAGKWIAHVALIADTHGHVVAHVAEGVDAAQAGTGVLAPAAAAGPVRWTVRVHHALGPTVGRRTDHVGQAGAAALTIDRLRGMGIGPAGIGIAGIFGRNNGFDNWKERGTSKAYNVKLFRYHS
jgi:hypothetical protein